MIDPITKPKAILAMDIRKSVAALHANHRQYRRDIEADTTKPRTRPAKIRSLDELTIRENVAKLVGRKNSFSR